MSLDNTLSAGRQWFIHGGQWLSQFVKEEYDRRWYRPTVGLIVGYPKKKEVGVLLTAPEPACAFSFLPPQGEIRIEELPSEAAHRILHRELGFDPRHVTATRYVGTTYHLSPKNRPLEGWEKGKVFYWCSLRMSEGVSPTFSPDPNHHRDLRWAYSRRQLEDMMVAVRREKADAVLEAVQRSGILW